MHDISPKASTVARNRRSATRGLIARILPLQFLVAVAVVLAFGMTAALAQQPELRDDDLVLGPADAKVTVFEYASMTCPHCAAFHKTTWPKLKEKYIDTGKIRFIFREFPLDNFALRGAMLARCSGPDKFYGFIGVLFDRQASWARAQDPMAALERIARFSGMKKADFDACMKNRELARKIASTRSEAGNKYQVNATPTFFINGEKLPGALSIEDFDEILKKELGE